jgi:4-nitrophenyl phosphatase
LLPGSGAILAAIEVAAGVQATDVGKPRPELVRLALERAGAEPSRTLVCGDRPDTDVAGARAAGVPVALVLTGVTLESDLGSLTERPDWIIRDIGELISDETPEPGALSGGVIAQGDTRVAPDREGQDQQ